MIRQESLLAWAVDTFGEVARDPIERSLRLIEEAAEVVQTVGLSKEEVLKVVERVYSRPPGALCNELGGLVMTTECLAEAMGYDLETQADWEYKRITSIPKEQWQRKHKEKVVAGTAVKA
jgi:NTP pyrophosphatase (non-canonical NTP hydrolase)